LPKDCNAFDFDTLSDVVIKLSYTASDGGKALADIARKSLHARWATTDQSEDATPMTPLRRMFRVRYEFSDAWTQFRNALMGGNATLALTIDRDRFPYLFRGSKITIVGVQLFVMLTDAIAQQSLTLTVTPPQGQGTDITLTPAPVDKSVLVSGLLDPPPSVDLSSGGDWTISAEAGFPIASVRDVAVVVTYVVAMK
jgi:hypothetical protein